jgi:hypothetical protein
MLIRCPECNGKLKVPESAAGKKVKCPACRAAVVIPHPDAEADDEGADEYGVRTPKAPAQSAADEPESPLPRKKSGRGGEKKKKKRPATVMDPRLVAGLGAAALLLIVGLVWLVVRGFSGGGGGGGIGAREVKGAPVIFSEPLADVPPPPKWEPQVLEPGKVPAAVALLPDAAGENSLTGGRAGPWEGKPDPAERAVEPLPANAVLHLRNEKDPLIASLGGPFAIEQQGDRSEKPDRPVIGIDDDYDFTPLLVKDLRTGKVAGKFAWKAPVWTAVRLSPDARYLVGPDNKPGAPATSKEGLLFVWEREKPEPVARLNMPGPVIWIDFVAPDKIAALSFEKKDGEGGPSYTPVLVVWSATTPEPEQSVALPEGEFTPPQYDPYTRQSATPESKTYFPDPEIGAVSPGGHHVALGGATAIQLVSIADGILIGAMHVPRNEIWRSNERGAPTYQGLAFGESGSELFGLLKAQQGWLLTWSLTSGLLTSLAGLPVKEFRGPPIPGPVPNTVIIPVWGFDDGSVMTPQGRPFSTAAVIDVRTGKVLVPITSRPLRRNGEGILTVSSLKFTPEVPLPPLPGIKLENLSDFDKQRLRERWVTLVAAVDAEAIRSEQAAQAADLVLPPARPGDRAGVASTKPAPPAEWKGPAAPPRAVEGLIGAYNVPNTPPLFGDAHVSFITGFVPPEDPKEQEKLRFAARTGNKADKKLKAAAAKAVPGVHWLRYDLRTGRLIEPNIVLGPHKAFTPRGALDAADVPLAVAMTRDGTRLAMRHPFGLARVDVWDNTGTHLMAIVPYPPAVPVQWVGWSAGGRLLTLSSGKFTAWDVPDGKAAYEVEGDYGLPVCPVRGNAWVAIAAETHIDLVDTESGSCLGRCLPEKEALDTKRPADLAIARDGSTLVYCGWQKKPDGEGSGVILTWDLASGKPMLRVPAGAPSRAMVALDSRRVLLGGTGLLDLGIPFAIGYQIPRFHSPDYMPFVEGALPGSPDTRIWAFGPEPGAEDSGRGMLRPLELPGYTSGPADPSFVFTKQTPLLVEVDMGEEERSRGFGKNLLKSLQSDGFTIGKGGWTLRATCEVKPTDTNLKFKGGWGGVVNVPRVLVHYKLYAPDGELAHTTGSTLELGMGSKYFRGQREVSKKFKGGEQITELEFTWDLPNSNPREAIVTELLDNLIKQGDLRLVSSLAKFKGKYEITPILVDAAFPPVPPAVAGK